MTWIGIVLNEQAKPTDSTRMQIDVFGFPDEEGAYHEGDRGHDHRVQ